MRRLKKTVDTIQSPDLCMISKAILLIAHQLSCQAMNPYGLIAMASTNMMEFLMVTIQYELIL